MPLEFSNSIFSNGALGIDLGGNGVTPNDPKDADVRSKQPAKLPVLATIATDGVHTTVTGSFNSTPNTVFNCSSFPIWRPTHPGYGEGQTLLGTRQVSPMRRQRDLCFTFPVGVSVGQFISATATDPQNNTSEFSAAIQSRRRNGGGQSAADRRSPAGHTPSTKVIHSRSMPRARPTPTATR